MKRKPRSKLPKNVYSEVSRHGKRVYYFREEKGLRVRLPDIASHDFGRSIDLARASGVSIAQKYVPRPNFDIRQKRDVGLALLAAIRGAKNRAAQRGLPFDIDLDWALTLAEDQNFKCSLTSIPFYMKSDAASKVRPYGPSLDRIDSKQGYTRDNTRLVIYAVNVMLMDWGESTFARVANGYRFTRGNKKRNSIPRPLPRVRVSELIVQ